MRKPACQILVLLSLCASLLAVPAAAEKNQDGTEWVVLLHGLGRSSRSLSRLEADLADVLKRCVLFNKFMAPSSAPPGAGEAGMSNPRRLRFYANSIGHRLA